MSISNAIIHDEILVFNEHAKKNTAKSELSLGQRITGTGEILYDLKPDGTERPWTQHKKDSLRLHSLYTDALKIDKTCISDSSYLALGTCASFLIYKVGANGERKLKNADFCRARLCPTCNWRKSLKMFGQASKITAKMLEDHATTRFIFVTLTIRNCEADQLRNTIELMNEGFSKLTAKSRKFAYAVKFKNNMLGYMRAIEVTYNEKENTYHPHIHAIFAVKPSYFKGQNYIKQADWQKLWQNCLELDYEPLVNVQVIKPKQGSKAVSEANPSIADLKQKAMAAAVAETAKYPVKTKTILELAEDIAIKVIITLSHALRRQRLVTFGGLFAEIRKQLQLDDLENGDLVHADESEVKVNEVAEILFRYQVKVGCYVC